MACPSLTFGRFAVICAVRTVMVEGRRCGRDRATLRQCVGVQLQEGSLRPKLTVFELADLFGHSSLGVAQPYGIHVNSRREWLFQQAFPLAATTVMSREV